MANEELKSRILAFVCEYADRNGFAPSYREIQLGTGIKSVSTVHDYVKRLEAEGRLEVHYLEPGMKPATFFAGGSKTGTVYAYCNLHGLWSATF